jgi:cytochrome c2
MRTLVIAVTALAASAGTGFAQDGAAGEQVFKRFCLPCHDIGTDAKVKLGPPLNGVDGRKSGTGADAARSVRAGRGRQRRALAVSEWLALLIRPLA